MPERQSGEWNATRPVVVQSGEDDPAMRVGVYNRHWPTLGGGERYAGGIAETLAADHDVEIIAHEPLDLAEVSERLWLDLSGVGVRVISASDPFAVTQASALYDLFVNVSYMSHNPSEAPRSIYVVHFPTAPDAMNPLKRVAVRVLRPLVQRGHHAPSRWGRGFYPWERERLGARRAWTTGAGEFYVDLPNGDEAVLDVLFGRDMPVELGHWKAEIEVDGEIAGEVVVRPSRYPLARPQVAKVRIQRRADREPSHVVIRSDTWVPAEVVGNDDDRHLGVRLAGVRFNRTVGTFLGHRYPILLNPPDLGAFLSSYTRVVSNSAFTQRYVREWWGRESDVLFPPVRMHARGEKRPIILSVGRFFAGHRGHSKKQLELVASFRRLHERGLRDWELHLVGGCSDEDRSYLDRVRQAAEGLPVEFHIGASGAEIGDLYASASVFWSATGIGEDYEQEPARFEHFGITTVEAMSAGAVPVVLARGGQPEIVRAGVDGLLFDTLDELVACTERVIRDDELRERFSASAHERAREFAMHAFGERLREVVDDLMRATQDVA
jgi:glycosyltransferase involved in cell wall biosynthesis